MSASRIEYSEKYADDTNEYRWVALKRSIVMEQKRLVASMPKLLFTVQVLRAVYVPSLTTVATLLDMSFFPRIWPNLCPKVVSWRKQNGVALVYSSLEDGNIMRFIGKYKTALPVWFWCGKAPLTFFFNLTMIQQSWTTHSSLSSSFGNWSTEWYGGSRIGTFRSWRVQGSVWNSPQVKDFNGNDER